jgi:hypothetical protein
MFFKTIKECHEFAQFIGFHVDVDKTIIRKGQAESHAVRINTSGQTIATYEIANKIVRWFGLTRSCILWVTEFGVWPSSENLHLYYKLRNSYGDYRTLTDAPGHLFLSYETVDLITFIDLLIQFGWGGFLLGTPNHNYITISHDKWILIESVSDICSIVGEIEKSNLPHTKLGLGRV